MKVKRIENFPHYIYDVGNDEIEKASWKDIRAVLLQITRPRDCVDVVV